MPGYSSNTYSIMRRIVESEVKAIMSNPSFICRNCKEPILLDKDVIAKDELPESIVCPKCKSVYDVWNHDIYKEILKNESEE